MRYILSVDNILVDSLEIYKNGYLKAKPLPGIDIFIRKIFASDNEIIILCKNLEQKQFINKNFTYIKDENIIIDNYRVNQIDLIENVIGRQLRNNDKLTDSPPNLSKIDDNLDIFVAVNDDYLFDEYCQVYDLSSYKKIYDYTIDKGEY